MSIEDAISQAIAEAKEQPPTNEATTCDWIIKPLLEAAGYSRREIEPQTRDANGQFPDYTILPATEHAWFLEAKAWNVALADQHVNQSLIYAFTNNRRWVVLTNGREWRLYDNNIQGELTGKLVYVVLLKDFDRMAAFLRAIGREGMINGAVDAYATSSRLKAILESELGSPDSLTVKAIQKVMKSQFSFTRVTGRDIVDALSSTPPTATPGIPVQTKHAVAKTTALSASCEGSKTYTLQELVDSKGALVTGQKPQLVIFPDGEEITVKKWIEIAYAIIRWLDQRQLLPEIPFPQTKKGKRYFLNIKAAHPAQNARHQFGELNLTNRGLVYMDTNRSADHIVRTLLSLNLTCSDVRVQMV